MSNEWKQKSLTPVTLSDEDFAYCTVKDLQNAIKKDDILNIAITGPYGSGKSSVLKTFKEKADPSIKILDISLATLDADTSKIFNISELKENHTEDKNIDFKSFYEQKELLSRKIEYSILQQLVYRKSLEALPFSRLKKIRHFDTHSIRMMAAYIVGFVICIAFALKFPIFQIPLVYEVFRVPSDIQDAISLVSVIFIVIIVYEILKYAIRNYGGLHLRKINVKGNEIDIHDDGSIFNRHLDEILYFFQCTDYNVVIIEDLDRFDTTEIFLKLRELNHLINKSEMVKRTIRFIYAVRDDMFKDSSRTKFFDYITTVIPIITTNNSKDKLKEALKNLGHEGEVSDDDIRDIAFHIDDMRLLNNIANEYHQYMQRLKSQQHPLKANKMLAMMTVKNYHPHDFSELHNRKGKLYKALSQESKREYVKIAIEKELSYRAKVAQENLDAYKATCHLSASELRLVYVMAIVNKINKPVHNIIINGNNYSFTDIACNENLFDKLKTVDAVSYNYYVNELYGGTVKESVASISFSDIENVVNKHYTYNQRASNLGANKDELEAKIREIEWEKKKISAYTIQELVENFNLYEEDYFKKIGLSNLEEDFIRRGFIAEDYNDYISYFYPLIMSGSDHQICMDMKLNRKLDYDISIDNVELFLKELPKAAFRYESTWNYQICNYLSNHKTRWGEFYELLIDNLTEVGNESMHFLYLYNENHSQAYAVFEDCMEYKAINMWNKISVAKEDEKDTLYRLWFVTCSLSDICASQLMWINKNYEFISTFYAELSDDKKEYLTHQCNFEKLTPTVCELLKEVVANGCYVLNKDTAQIIVETKDAKEDITKLSNFEEMQFALQCDLVTASWSNVKKYYKQSGNKIDDTLTAYIERHIVVLTTGYRGDDKFADFFQILLQHNAFSDNTFMQLCNVNPFPVKITPEIQSLSHAKIIMLIETKSFNYDLAILNTLNTLSPNLSCAYMVVNKDKLLETTHSVVMSTELAEALLYHNGFNQNEYMIIIASLTPSNVTINESLANKIGMLMSLQYLLCDETIFSESIRLCSNKANAVFSVARKIRQNHLDNTSIDTLLAVLPIEYHELSELGKHPKLEENNHNKLLVKSLQSADYISSYSIEKGVIKVNTKRK